MRSILAVWILLGTFAWSGLADDHGDSALSATPIAVDGVLVDACIEAPEDMDYFLFAAVAGRSYRILVTHQSLEMEAIVYLLGSDGQTILAVAHNPDDGAGARIRWTAPTDGTVFAMVRHAQTFSGTGCYALSRLNDEQIPASCEGDLQSMFSMFIGYLLTGQTAFMANIASVEPEERIVGIAHCTCPLSMTSEYTIRSHFESGLGIGISGTIFTEAELRRLAELALENNLFVISDEAYHFFVYDGLTPSSIIDFEEFQDRLIITRSFSKHYHMTGYRIGYVVADRKIIQAIVKLQSHVSGNVCTFVQYGALSALQNENQIFSRHRVELEKNRDIAYEYANRMFNCIKPQGAFYVFPDISGHLSNGATAEDFAGKLLRKTGVAVVPGEAFGVADHIRISYAVPEEMLREGLEKIAEVL